MVPRAPPATPLKGPKLLTSSLIVSTTLYQKSTHLNSSRKRRCADERRTNLSCLYYSTYSSYVDERVHIHPRGAGGGVPLDLYSNLKGVGIGSGLGLDEGATEVGAATR